MTLEMVKFVQGIIISNDNEMVTRVTNTESISPTVQSSNLNEELGQIKHIFTDKTGTLTANKMEFRCLCVGGHSYGKTSTRKQFWSFPNDSLGEYYVNSRQNVPYVNFTDDLFEQLLRNGLPDQRKSLL